MLKSNPILVESFNLSMSRQDLPSRFISDKVLQIMPKTSVGCNTLSGAHHATRPKTKPTALHAFSPTALLDDRTLGIYAKINSHFSLD
jgi:hypothetical protein